MDGQRHKAAMGRLRHDVLVGSHLMMAVRVEAKATEREVGETPCGLCAPWHRGSCGQTRPTKHPGPKDGH